MSMRSAIELYEDDFFAWTQLQAKELRRFARTRPNLPLDLAHIAEEIADLGKSQRDSVRSWTRRIIEHLLLIEHSPAEEPRRGWIDEIVDTSQRDRGPSDADAAAGSEATAPASVRSRAADLARKLERYGEGERCRALPKRCPYTLDQVLGDFWPDAERSESRGRCGMGLPAAPPGAARKAGSPRSRRA